MDELHNDHHLAETRKYPLDEKVRERLEVSFRANAAIARNE